MKVAVVGAGIAGLSCAYELSRPGQPFDVTLFEANSYFGGHTNTVDVTLEGMTYGVDTGFLVFNHRTYPNLLKLFDELEVETAPSDMSFSVMLTDRKLEWAGSNLNTVFAQRSNLLRPGFLRMLRDVLRFNKLATALALKKNEAGAEVSAEVNALRDEPVAAFLSRHGFSQQFKDAYLLPMVGAIWSCPTQQMMAFPIGTLIQFCHNHGLLQVGERPQWYTVKGGAREYVRRMLLKLADARVASPVLAVMRGSQNGRPAVAVQTATGTEWFDHVVLATHSDQSRRLLHDASSEESRVLEAIQYALNRAVLHTDASLLPSRRAQSAWNYESRQGLPGGDAELCVHYLINRLQPLPFKQAVLLSLNPIREPHPASVLQEIHYSHPVFDAAAVLAQSRLPGLQGDRHTWFCGAWTGYGFHEDGLKSGLAVAQQLKDLAQQTGSPLPQSLNLATESQAA
jgi:predicted NAD/FAD-binding protein